jgi:membrane protein
MTSFTLTSRVKRIIRRINDDEVFGRAAQLSYYFLLALFPLLLVLINLLGFLAQQGTEFRTKLISYLAAVMPSSAVALFTPLSTKLAPRVVAAKYHSVYWLRYGQPQTEWVRLARR